MIAEPLGRYVLEESSVYEWHVVASSDSALGAFRILAKQFSLMRRGAEMFPTNADDYKRGYRVIDTHRDMPVVWPGQGVVLDLMGTAPLPTDGHMIDALRYVTQGIEATHLVRSAM